MGYRLTRCVAAAALIAAAFIGASPPSGSAAPVEPRAAPASDPEDPHVGTELYDTPMRMYDSRHDPAGKLGAGEVRTVALQVPAGAHAALVTVTVDQTEGSGFVSLAASGAGVPSTSNINWAGSGESRAASAVVPVDAVGRIDVAAGGGETHVIIDVTGHIPGWNEPPAPGEPERDWESEYRVTHLLYDLSIRLNDYGDSGEIWLLTDTEPNPWKSVTIWDRLTEETILTFAEPNLYDKVQIDANTLSAFHFAYNTSEMRLSITDEYGGLWEGQVQRVKMPPEVLAAPERAYDSRAVAEGALAPHESRTIDLDVPADVHAAMVTVTADRTEAAGYLTAHAAGTPVPPTSTLAWHRRGETVATGTTVRVDDEGRITVTNGPSPTHVIIDLAAHVPGLEWTASATASDLEVRDAPIRVHDSRSDAATPGALGTLAPGETRTIDLDLPPGARGAVVTVTVDQTEGSGYLTLHRDGTSAPGSSNLNWSGSGGATATTAIVPVDEHGRIAVTNGPTSTHLIVDAVGHLNDIHWDPGGFGDVAPATTGQGS